MARHPLLPLALVGAFCALTSAAQDATTFVDSSAEDLFKYARMAIARSGGSIAQLRALVFRGHSLLQMPDRSLANGIVEIKILLPDHYLRTDRVGSADRVAGYAGKTLLSVMRQGGNTMLPPEDLKPQLLKSERVRLARLLLGAVTYVSGDLALTFKSIGGPLRMNDPRRSPRTSASVDMSTIERFAVDVSGENFGGRLLMDATSQVPVRLTYNGADKKPESMTFADRRTVAGFELPHRISIVAGEQTLEDLVFDEVLVNPEIGKGDFKR